MHCLLLKSLSLDNHLIYHCFQQSVLNLIDSSCLLSKPGALIWFRCSLFQIVPVSQLLFNSALQVRLSIDTKKGCMQQRGRARRPFYDLRRLLSCTNMDSRMTLGFTSLLNAYRGHSKQFGPGLDACRGMTKYYAQKSKVASHDHYQNGF